MYDSGQSLNNLVVQTVSGTVSSPVTVSTSLINVVSAPSVTVTAGQTLQVRTHIHITKGGTAGLTQTKVYQSAGTAVLDWLDNAGSVACGHQWPSHAANILGVHFAFDELKVTTGGTCTLTIEALSNGSDSTVGNGGATIQVKVFR